MVMNCVWSSHSLAIMGQIVSLRSVGWEWLEDEQENLSLEMLRTAFILLCVQIVSLKCFDIDRNITKEHEGRVLRISLPSPGVLAGR